MNGKKKPIIAIILILSLNIISCTEKPELEYNNIYDPDSPDYISPLIGFVKGPFQGEIIKSPEAVFTWQGNDIRMDYCYCLDDSEWSNWYSICFYRCKYLDEGPHTFRVKGRYQEKNKFITIRESQELSVTFTVDAVNGPALIAKPRYTVVKSDENKYFTIQIIAEEVRNLMLANVILTYDPRIVEAIKTEKGDFLAENGGTVVYFDNIDKKNGKIDISTGVSMSKPKGIDGSGVISLVTFKALTKVPTTISINKNSKFRDSNNKDIYIREMVEGIIEIN